jgi:hypothetical protein
VSELTIPDTDDLEASGSQLVRRAEALAVTTNDEYASAGTALVGAASLRKAIVAAFAEPKRAAHRAHVAITALERRLLDAPRKAESILRARMLTYQRAEDARRRERERVAQEELMVQEEDRRLAVAASLESAGYQAEAEAVIDAPMVVPPVALPAPEAEGVSVRRAWAWRLIDEARMTRQYLTADERKISSLVRSMGPDAAVLVGGIEVYEETSLTVRTGR